MAPQADKFVPAIEVEVAAKSKEDRARLIAALSAISADGTLCFEHDDETGDVKVLGVDEGALGQALEDLQRLHHVDFSLSAPKIAYRETITRPVTVEYEHRKPKDRAREYARIRLVVEPRPAELGYLLHTEDLQGSLPRHHIDAIERGLSQGLKAGIVEGFPVIALAVVVSEGVCQDEECSDAAFTSAARMAVQEALWGGHSVMLEPVTALEVTTPVQFADAIIRDLKARRAHMAKGDSGSAGDIGDATVVRALVPAATMFGYMSALRELTHGHASYAIKFDHYAQVLSSDDPPFRPAAAIRA
jgi:elongation factor G